MGSYRRARIGRRRAQEVETMRTVLFRCATYLSALRDEHGIVRLSDSAQGTRASARERSDTKSDDREKRAERFERPVDLWK
jgi:hypothetical protein